MSDYWQSALGRARDRLEYCRRELGRFERHADWCNPKHERTLTKLERDVTLAEQDVGYAQHALAELAEMFEE